MLNSAKNFFGSMRDLEKYSEHLAGPRITISTILCILGVIYYIYVAIFGIQFPQVDRSLFIFLGIVVAILENPLGRHPLLRLVDLLLLAAAALATIRFNVMYETFLVNVGLAIDTIDIVFGIMMAIICLEAARRVIGWIIPFISFLFLLYLYLGNIVPGTLRHSGFSLETIAGYLYASTDGLYGIITYIFASQLFLFLIFGTLLIASGASDFSTT